MYYCVMRVMWHMSNSSGNGPNLDAYRLGKRECLVFPRQEITHAYGMTTTLRFCLKKGTYFYVNNIKTYSYVVEVFTIF